MSAGGDLQDSNLKVSEWLSKLQLGLAEEDADPGSIASQYAQHPC